MQREAVEIININFLNGKKGRNIMRASGGLHVCKSSDQTNGAYWLLSCLFTVATPLQAYLCPNTLEMTRITAARSHDHKDQGTELGRKWKRRENKVNM